jgi:hypothetical protein
MAVGRSVKVGDVIGIVGSFSSIGSTVFGEFKTPWTIAASVGLKVVSIAASEAKILLGDLRVDDLIGNTNGAQLSTSQQNAFSNTASKNTQGEQIFNAGVETGVYHGPDPLNPGGTIVVSSSPDGQQGMYVRTNAAGVVTARRTIDQGKLVADWIDPSSQSVSDLGKQGYSPSGHAFGQTYLEGNPPVSITWSRADNGQLIKQLSTSPDGQGVIHHTTIGYGLDGVTPVGSMSIDQTANGQFTPTLNNTIPANFGISAYNPATALSDYKGTYGIEIKAGDNINSIANRVGMPVEELRQYLRDVYGPDADLGSLQAGRFIPIPQERYDAMTPPTLDQTAAETARLANHQVVNTIPLAGGLTLTETTNASAGAPSADNDTPPTTPTTPTETPVSAPVTSSHAVLSGPATGVISTTDVQIFTDDSRIETTTLPNGTTTTRAFDTDRQPAGSIVDTPDGDGGIDRVITTRVNGKDVVIKQHASEEELYNNGGSSNNGGNNNGGGGDTAAPVITDTTNPSYIAQFDANAGNYTSYEVRIGGQLAVNNDLICRAIDEQYGQAAVYAPAGAVDEIYIGSAGLGIIEAANGGSLAGAIDTTGGNTSTASTASNTIIYDNPAEGPLTGLINAGDASVGNGFKAASIPIEAANDRCYSLQA